MPFNGSGVYTPPVADFPVVTNTVISSTHFNNTINDIASGLTNCLTKDGQTTPTANIKLGGFKLTGVGVATVSGDALSFGQAATVTTLAATTSVTSPILDSGSGSLVLKGAGTTAITITAAATVLSGALTAGGTVTIGANTLALAGSTVSGTPTWSSTQAMNISGNAATATLASTVTTNANLTGGVTSVGNAATVVTNANLTGPITSVGNATTIASGNTYPSPTFTGTVSGTPTWASSQAITLSTAAQPNITSVGTLTSLTISGTITITAAASKIVPGATSLSLRNNADSADNILIADNGDVTVRGNLTATGISASPNFTSAETAIPGSGAVSSFAHGLGVVPRQIRIVMRNKITELGYTVGEEVTLMNNSATFAQSADATNVILTSASSALFQVVGKSSFSGTTITNADWRLVVRAWI